jgi:hypothetical protein
VATWALWFYLLDLSLVIAVGFGYNGRAQGPAPTAAGIKSRRGSPLWAPANLYSIIIIFRDMTRYFRPLDLSLVFDCSNGRFIPYSWVPVRLGVYWVPWLYRAGTGTRPYGGWHNTS